MADNELLIKIEADAKNANAAFDNIEKKTENLSSSLASVTKVSAVAFAAFTAEIGLAVSEFAEAEAIGKQLNLTLQNQGIYSRALADSYRAQADEISRLTGIDDDAIVKGQSLLQNLIGQTEITKELTQAAVDLGAKLGSTEAGFEAIGRAVNGQTRGLKVLGIEIDQGLTRQERLAQVTQKVSQVFAGQAATLNSGLGSYRGLITAFQQLQEEIGQRFAPIITAAIQKITSFLQALRENQGLLTFAAGAIAFTASITGMVAAFTTLGQVLLVARASMAAFGVVTAASLGPIGLVVAALGLASAGFAAYAINAGEASKQTGQLDQSIEKTKERIQSLQKAVDLKIPGFLGPNTLQELEKAKNDLADLEERKRKLNSQESAKASASGDTGQDAVKKAAADRAEKERNAQDARERAAQKAKNEALILETEQASQRQIEIAKQKATLLAQIASDENIVIRESLIARYQELLVLEEEQRAADLERRAAYAEEDAALAAELAKIDIDSKAILREQDTRELEAQLLTQKEIERKIAIETAQERIKNRNLELEDRKKYGVAVSTLNAALRSDEVQGAKAISAELIGLAQSKNATLKAIGKAAAISNVIIGTAESVATIATQVPRVIPFPFSIPVIAALVGARVAFGVEQISTIQGAADGALVQGGIPGRDSVPFMLEPGELVTPKRNFEEVVGAVQGSRSSRDDEILQQLVLLNEKPTGQNVVVNGDVLGDDVWIDRLISKLNDRIEFGNAQLRLS